MKQQSLKTIRKCPVCQRNDAYLLHEIRYPAEPNRILPVCYRIAACKYCGMVYDDFDASETVFVKHYQTSGKYEMEETGGAGGNSIADQKRWKMVTEFLEPYLSRKDLSVIDIGCGKGGLLQFLWEAGYHNLFGLDASPGCIQYIHEHCAFPAVCCDVANFHTEKKFDLVLSTQVLEHLFFCREYLKAAHKLLSPEGIIYLEMPDASNYIKYGKAPFYYFDQEHINHFQPDSLRNLLEQCGFSVTRLNQFTAEPIPGFQNPNVRLAARRADSINRDNFLQSNDFSCIEEYIEDCKKRDQKLKQIPVYHGTGYLWGVGANCERLLEQKVFDHLNLAGLIDIDPKKQGTKVHGLTIFPPEILKENESAEKFIIITSVLYEKSIRKQLSEAGFDGQIITFE